LKQIDASNFNISDTYENRVKKLVLIAKSAQKTQLFSTSAKNNPTQKEQQKILFKGTFISKNELNRPVKVF
jgi:hypothetical protein